MSDWLPAPEAQDKKYAFKCHRQTIDDVDHVWPVNALAFHPTYTYYLSLPIPRLIFMTSAIATMRFHRAVRMGPSLFGKVKKRLRQYPKLNNALSSLAFNCNGTKLAFSLSYTWDDGEAGLKTAERPLVVVRKLGDEVKVRRVKCHV